MRSNVNMTGNFSNTKSSKPGDTIFSNRKENAYGVNRNVTNTNANFGMNMTKDKMKYNESELNEAKDSLKLFKKKIGESSINGNLGMGSRGSNQINNKPMPTSTITANSNYRKPFKPSFANEEESENTINMDTKKRVQVPRNQTNKVNSNTIKQMPLKTQQIKDIDDDRPAFAQRNQNFEAEIEDQDEGELEQCAVCGRKFNLEAFQKHAKVCKKVFATKAKPFDMKKQRVIDSEHAMMLKHKEFEEKKKSKTGVNNLNTQSNNKQAKKKKWEKQSEEFRAILKANRTTTNGFGVQGNVGSKTGTNYNKGSYTNTPSVLTEDYTLCNMCNRRYNEQAYSKHLPTCERRTKEAQMKGKVKQASGTNNFGSKPNLNVKFGKK